MQIGTENRSAGIESDPPCRDDPYVPGGNKNFNPNFYLRRITWKIRQGVFLFGAE
jgi:hypothetical protein